MADNDFNNPEEAFETNNALFDEVNDVNPVADQALGEDANVDENNNVNNNNNNGEDDVEPPSYNQDEGNENENANQAESDKKEINDIMENIFGGSDEEDSVGKQDKPSDARSDLDDDELERENNKKMEKIKQKKNKKRKKSDEDDEGSDKKKRKKRKKERQIEEDGQDQDDAPRPSSEGNQQDDIEAKFKEVLERSKKKRYKGPSEQEVDETVDKTLDMMLEAFEDDMNAINNKQPALKRLAILPTILEQLARIPLHDKLLEKGACEQIRAWLQPLPDNTLPNLKIREGLLRVLLKFNGINSTHLSESLLGRIVLMLSRRPDETKENRKMAATLVTKWARPIFGLDDKPNAADMIPQQNFAPAPKALPKKNVAASQNDDMDAERNTAISAPRAAIPELLAKKGHGYVRARAAVPEKARMDYTMKPASKLDDAMPIKKSTGARVKSNRLDKLIKGKEVASGGRSNSMNITKGSLE